MTAKPPGPSTPRPDAPQPAKDAAQSEKDAAQPQKKDDALSPVAPNVEPLMDICLDDEPTEIMDPKKLPDYGVDE